MSGILLDVFGANKKMRPEKASKILSGAPTTAKALQFLVTKDYLALANNGKGMPG